LGAVLTGATEPADSKETRTFAKIAMYEQRYGAATALFLKAFEQDAALAAEPDPTDDNGQTYRFAAACAAARAGCGHGADAANFESSDQRATWRRQALAWLAEDLESLEQHVSAARKATVDKKVRTRLNIWKNTFYFAGLRELDEVRQLPESEREACGAAWDRVDRLLERVAPKPDRPHRQESP
jgi:hypothetical protein